MGASPPAADRAAGSADAPPPAEAPAGAAAERTAEQAAAQRAESGTQAGLVGASPAQSGTDGAGMAAAAAASAAPAEGRTQGAAAAPAALPTGPGPPAAAAAPERVILHLQQRSEHDREVWALASTGIQRFTGCVDYQSCVLRGALNARCHLAVWDICQVRPWSSHACDLPVSKSITSRLHCYSSCMWQGKPDFTRLRCRSRRWWACCRRC